MNDRIRRLLERLTDDRGGTIPPSAPDSPRYERAGVVHPAEYVVPDGHGDIIHAQATADGEWEYTTVDPAEYDEEK
ncbi:hypothetical protein Bra3105_06625 [Brachybacterium halotolerans subsp. kimchii]|uniref:hypothetical protein n=1 Tax=Brachybacterium halotolerans TaxID=2795215 RepID=UPI001E554834|nr:hypothetical protein [Brachybacterium halotolerans]UEJ83981.1 hypothetical protein Bra3105_06625 [Brachybacterium halotolerans subsp. kimchii]